MTRQHFIFGLFSGTVFMVLTTGCYDAQSADIISRRQDNLARTTQRFKDIEASSPQSMGWLLGQLRKQNEQDLDNTSKNPYRVKGMIQRDFDRWAEQQPAYNDVINRELKGNPDTIRQTAPKMVW